MYSQKKAALDKSVFPDYLKFPASILKRKAAKGDLLLPPEEQSNDSAMCQRLAMLGTKLDSEGITANAA